MPEADMSNRLIVPVKRGAVVVQEVKSCRSWRLCGRAVLTRCRSRLCRCGRWPWNAGDDEDGQWTLVKNRV